MKTLRTGMALIILALGFLGFNLLSSHWLKGHRVDLTENQLYTLSPGSRNILKGLDQPIELTFYFSDGMSKELSALRAYSRRVLELLQEYEVLSAGKLKLKVVDPEPFSEAEDNATAAGLQGIPVGGKEDTLYFGLVGHNQRGNEEVIPFFQLDKEQFLEYEVSKLVYKLRQTKKPALAILSGLDINGGFDMARQTPQPAWVVVEQLQDLYDVRWLAEDVDTIDADVDTLMLVHPKKLTEPMQYAIDQFVMRGGKVLVFVDPYAEADRPNLPSTLATQYPRSSNLEPLFKAWGIQMADNQVIGDYTQSLVVGVGPNRDPVRHLALLGLKPSSFNTNDVVLAGLDTINVSTAGILTALPGATTQFTPLLSSSTESAPLAAKQFATLANPATLFDNFEATGEVYVLAARLNGPAQTAFPQGIGNLKPKLLETKNLHVIVVADTDILSDRLWVNVQDFYGQHVATPWADNSAFVVNALENLSGSEDLISVRSRGRFSRPFLVVDALQRQAEEQLRDKEQELRDRLSDTEAKLDELQKPQNGQAAPTLTDEQHQLLLQFQQEKLKIRKQLRDVQHELNRDIDRLGRELKLINILLVPALLTVLALLAKFLQRQRRRKA